MFSNMPAAIKYWVAGVIDMECDIPSDAIMKEVFSSSFMSATDQRYSSLSSTKQKERKTHKKTAATIYYRYA